MSYFTNLPSIKYRDRYAPNILISVRLAYDLLETAEIYHPFVIPEGDRPDNIADLYYGDAEADWLIYLANGIIDIKSQWPLTSTLFNDYLNKKYGSFSATNSIHHYDLKINIPNITEEQYKNVPQDTKKYWTYDINSSTYEVLNIGATMSPSSFNNLSAQEKLYWSPRSIYDHEFELNEEKRKIRLIDKTYRESLENTLKNVINE